MIGDQCSASQPKIGVVGLALLCSSMGFCLGFWVVDTAPIRAVAVCAMLIGLILGCQLGRNYQFLREGRG